jgi:uncharacterized membrane protein
MRGNHCLTIRHAACLLALCSLILLIGCSKQPALYREAPLKGDSIVIPLSEVKDGNAHFYTYRKSGKRINFFVRTDANGTVSSYFDACFTCYKPRKGYRQEGSDLICNECSMKFGLAEEKWSEKGGCNPIHLKSTITDNSLVIETAVIEKGAKLF